MEFNEFAFSEILGVCLVKYLHPHFVDYLGRVVSLS